MSALRLRFAFAWALTIFFTVVRGYIFLPGAIAAMSVACGDAGRCEAVFTLNCGCLVVGGNLD